MAVTSVKVGSLELIAAGTYSVGNDTLYQLYSGSPAEARLVQMADRYPAYVGTLQSPRQIDLLVFLLASTGAQRQADYNALASALTNSGGLLALTWTDSGTTRRYWCHVDSIEPSQWMTRVSAKLLAPKPDAEVV